MKCKNCGAIIHEGDTFCRTCATPIEDEINDKPQENIATREFSSINKISNIKEFPKPQEIKEYQYQAPVSKEKDPKDLINKDPNNRVKATIINVLELVILLVFLFVVGNFIFNIISNL